MCQEEFVQTVMAQEEYERIVKPTLPITDTRFVYRNSAQTNVQETWKRFGWQLKEHTNADQR